MKGAALVGKVAETVREPNAIVSKEDSSLLSSTSEIDISALHLYPNEALLFFVCTHLLIFKDFSMFYSKYLNF